MDGELKPEVSVGLDEETRARLGRLGVPATLPLPRWFAVLATLCAVGLVPWIVFLAVSLPTETRAAHYDTAWVGFDAMMFVSLAAMAVAATRRSTWIEPVAICTATLLVVDAWFDIVTAAGQMHVIEALIEAVAIELPLALLCGWVAFNTERFRRTTFRRLAGRILRDARAADLRSGERRSVNAGSGDRR